MALTVKALKEGKVIAKCVLMLDEMYLQKSTEYDSGSIIGQDANGEFTGLPEVSINGEMVKQEI